MAQLHMSCEAYAGLGGKSSAFNIILNMGGRHTPGNGRRYIRGIGALFKSPVRWARGLQVRFYLARHGDAFSETFIEGLRRDISRWKAELSMLDVGQEKTSSDLLTSELRSWIDAGEAVFAHYERCRT